MASILRRFFGGAASNAGGYAIGGAITPALAPITQDLSNIMWTKYPNIPVPPEALAGLVARGLLDVDVAQKEALKSGIDTTPFAQLVTGALHAPETAEMLDLWRRGVVGEGDVEEAFHENGIRARWRGPLKALRHYLVPPSDLVRMGVREVFNPALRAELDLDAEYPGGITEPADQVGISEANMRNYWAAHWELPSYTQGAQMLFRGKIGPQKFRDLLKALDYSPTWRGPLEEIARAIPTVSDFIRFAVREVFSPAQRRALKLDEDYPAILTEKAGLHGLSEEDARDYWAAHWQLPSPSQGYHMLWRGLINRPELDGLLKALDYSPQWRDKLASIAHLVPGRVDLRRMLEHNIIDRAEVKRGYVRLGYTDADAETLTLFAEELAKGSPKHAVWADRARSRLFTVTHNEFLQGSIDEDVARGKLMAIGVPEEEQFTVITLWKSEAEINRLELTPAQIFKAYKRALYTRGEALNELFERGMTEEDANIYLDSSGPLPKT
jgi:hypothetical protein